MTRSSFRGRRAVMATMHGKERAFGPVLGERLGLTLELAPGIDTDALGTFTGEIDRAGSMLETARAKAELGLAASGLDLAVANEGAYGPNPQLPFIPLGMELAILIDRSSDLVIVEQHVDEQPTYQQVVLARGQSPHDFLDRVGFPAQRVVVKLGAAGEGPCVGKGLGTLEQLERAMAHGRRAAPDGVIMLQTDMRAHFNPRRMETLEVLAERLATRATTCCPACGRPGFGHTATRAGLPCEWCGGPSIMALGELWSCGGCEHEELRPRPDGLSTADPGACPRCNP